MTAITPEQPQAVAEAGDLPVELADPQTGTAYVSCVPIFTGRCKNNSSDEDLREHRAWARLARKTRDDSAQENTY